MHIWPPGDPQGYRENSNSKSAVPLKPTAFTAFCRIHSSNIRILPWNLSETSIYISSTILAPQSVNIGTNSMTWVYCKLRLSIFISSYYPSPTRGNRGFTATPHEGHPIGRTKTWFRCLIAPRRGGGTLLSQGCEYFFPLLIWTFFGDVGANSEWGGGGTGNLAH